MGFLACLTWPANSNFFLAFFGLLAILNCQEIPDNDRKEETIAQKLTKVFLLYSNLAWAILKAHGIQNIIPLSCLQTVALTHLFFLRSQTYPSVQSCFFLHLPFWQTECSLQYSFLLQSLFLRHCFATTHTPYLWKQIPLGQSACLSQSCAGVQIMSLHSSNSGHPLFAEHIFGVRQYFSFLLMFCRLQIRRSLHTSV